MRRFTLVTPILLVAAVGLAMLGGCAAPDYDRTHILAMDTLAHTTAHHLPETSLRPAHRQVPIFPTTLKRGRYWKGQGGFSFGLDLAEGFHDSVGGRNQAKALLDHYFAGLTQAGLRQRGGDHPGITGITDSPLDTASNTWTFGADTRLVVRGHVVVDSTSRRALVTGWILAE